MKRLNKEELNKLPDKPTMEFEIPEWKVSLLLQGISKKIHLHARDIRGRRPNGKELFITAELPNHMKSSWSQLGFDSKNYKDPF